MDERLRNHLKEARSRVGLTQQELAEKIGVSRKTINTIENGVFVPSTLLALKLAKAFKTRVEELFELEEEH
jgi:putative transcriptional regulator